MSKQEAERFIKYGSIAAFVAVALGAIVIGIVRVLKPDAPLPVASIVILVVIAALAYGLKRKNRVCGAVLSVLLIGSIVSRMIESRSIATSFGGLAIAFFVVVGTIAAFKWHKLVEKEKTA